ncbi:HK97 family phage prohead protease [Frigoriglobus tundricola]|uniref:Phage maturation protease n=1 Tax=Frigoriglobus tundricola TaxID=2774151 RepID=A0A6M5YL07_9BACT|nr:HK97 family phage prohead protease [Frigoriglobus tundricola]QJW94707.1 Phage maturation protease [Frigoriglobus tundricola]
MPHGEIPGRRYTRHGLPVGVATRADGKPTITGYAAVFYDENDPGTEYQMYTDMYERIMPGAFDRALREDDVRGTFNHDDSIVLGRTKSGTMRLSVDRKGLKYEIDPPDTQAARDLMESIRRGDVSGSSFMFVPDENTYRSVGDKWIVERNSVRLFDVGPVTFPAYDSTDSACRSAPKGDAEAVRREIEAWKQRRGWSIPAIKARAQAVAVTLALESRRSR